MSLDVRQMEPGDIPGAVALQRACFPAPFPDELLWRPEHLTRHRELFPEGQLVAILDGEVVGSASNARISEDRYQAHGSWEETVGGPFMQAYDPDGTTLYGMDISVHPAHRGSGVGRALYVARFDLVRRLGLVRYATACRLPDWAASGLDHESYVREVWEWRLRDRTLTPLLRYGLEVVAVLHGYMEDKESGNAAALLEWKP